MSGHKPWNEINLKFKQPTRFYRIRFWLRFHIERLIWDLGTRLREWACVSAGGSHDYLSDHPEDACIVCGHERVDE